MSITKVCKVCGYYVSYDPESQADAEYMHEGLVEAIQEHVIRNHCKTDSTGSFVTDSKKGFVLRDEFQDEFESVYDAWG